MPGGKSKSGDEARDSSRLTGQTAVNPSSRPDTGGGLPPDPVLGNLFRKAVDVALRLHTEPRKGPARIPYLAHLLAVAAIVIEARPDEELAVAALLHDTLEDTEYTASQMLEDFGERVTQIVEGCSDGARGQERTAGTWKERKQGYLKDLRSAGPDVLLVSLADKLHNARSILADLRTEGVSVFKRFNAPREEQRWYYAGLVNSFENSPIAKEQPHLVEQLRATVEQIFGPIGVSAG